MPLTLRLPAGVVASDVVVTGPAETGVEVALAPPTLVLIGGTVSVTGDETGATAAVASLMTLHHFSASLGVCALNWNSLVVEKALPTLPLEVSLPLT